MTQVNTSVDGTTDLAGEGRAGEVQAGTPKGGTAALRGSPRSFHDMLGVVVTLTMGAIGEASTAEDAPLTLDPAIVGDVEHILRRAGMLIGTGLANANAAMDEHTRSLLRGEVLHRLELIGQQHGFDAPILLRMFIEVLFEELAEGLVAGVIG